MSERTAASGEISVEFTRAANLRPARSVNKTAEMPHLCPTLRINQQQMPAGGVDGSGGPTATRGAILTRRGVRPVKADVPPWRGRWEVADLSLCSKSFQV